MAKSELKTQTHTQIGNSKIRNWVRSMFILCCTILYLGAVPLFLIAFSPIYIFRLLASQAKKIFRPDLDKLVNTRSVVLAVDGFPDNPKWNLVVWLTQEGVLDIHKFRSYFNTDYVSKELPNGRLEYPEYRQHLEKWWGFYFWRWDPHFDIRNHIREYDGEIKGINDVINDNDLLQIIKELTWKPWLPKRSPWEFLQISNYSGGEHEAASGKKSILIFRIHHVIGDGYAVLKLLMEDICGISLQRAAQPNYIKKTAWSRVVDNGLFWIRAPYQFVQMMVESKDNNPWHTATAENGLKRPLSSALTRKIPLDYIKGIKDLHHVNFTAVLMAAVAGGIRNTMIEQGIQNPTDLHQAIPVPLPGHPKKLRNHFICSFIKLPVGTADPLQRLIQAEESIQNLKNSSVPFLNFLKVPLIGGLFPWMMRPMTVNRNSTCIMSNFPGTPEIPHFRDVDVVDMMFGAGLGPGNPGVCFTLISYVGYIRLLSAVDPNILDTDEKVEELNFKILRELEIMNSLGQV